MTHIALVALAVAISPFILSSSEPSAFGAGNLNNPQPYGLTATEEVILENKQNLHKVVVDTNNQANKVDSIRDRIDGLQGVIEGLAKKSQENKLALQLLNETKQKEIQNSSEYEKRLSEMIENNTKNIEGIKTVITELSSLIDGINKTYVTKNEFNTLVEEVNKFKVLVSKELKGNAKSSDLEKLSSYDIATKAHDFYNKKLYDKSIEYYAYLIEKNYKPANAHYMIAEMQYYRKNYSEAIAYFKKSAALYDKASYMPILMLHTAVAMEKTGDKSNAKSFYSAIISKFPETEYASTAEKYLSLMK
jgi:TolA-binding protein